MKRDLTADSLTGLLKTLGGASDEAGEKYEALRRLLIRFFEWRGSPYPDEHADETLNRVARKADEGIEIENINAYTYEVARFVYLEAMKSRDAKSEQLNDKHLYSLTAGAPNAVEESSQRLNCLDKCLANLPDENRRLIIEYYKNDDLPMIDHRRSIAERLGLRRDALANRMQRIRDKLEYCVKKCVNE